MEAAMEAADQHAAQQGNDNVMEVRKLENDIYYVSNQSFSSIT